MATTHRVQFAKISNLAITPQRATPLAAGLDLFSAHSHTIHPNQRSLCFTNIQVAVPVGYYGRIAPRSGLALHHSLGVLAGVVDCDFRGDVGVLLMNHGDLVYNVRAGERIAQLIIEKICLCTLEEVAQLPDTMPRPRRHSQRRGSVLRGINGRGVNGFGSSGY